MEFDEAAAEAVLSALAAGVAPPLSSPPFLPSPLGPPASPEGGAGPAASASHTSKTSRTSRTSRAAWLRRARARLVSGGFRQLLCPPTLEVELLPHQKRAVERVLRELRGRAILADEVGLGKTIEAGAILKEYLLRGLVRRALILVPAALVAQWRRELREKLRIAAAGWPPRECGQEGLGSGYVVLISLEAAKRPERARQLQQVEWDLVVVDEAHRLKSHDTLNWRFVNGLSKGYLLLLTATPVQNELRELYNLVTLLRPGQLGTYRAFKQQFARDARSPKNLPELKRRLVKVMVRTTRREAGLELPPRIVERLDLQPTPAELAFHDHLLSTLRSLYRQAPTRQDRHVLVSIVLLQEACSSPQAACRTLAALARAGGSPWREHGPALEALVAAGRALCQAEGSKLAALRALLRRAGSAGAGARWGEDSREASEEGSGAGSGGVPGGKVVVFTQFRATLEVLAQALAADGIQAAIYHGGLSPAERSRSLQRFAEGWRVLLATDAGSEGHNLQFSPTLINYDLPWNPMRLEQRIGRVHRLGQQAPQVRVVNLALRRTLEDHLLDLLDRKLGMFRQVIGDIDEVLDGGLGFERRFGEMALEAHDPQDLALRLERLGSQLALRLETARRAEAKARALLDVDGPGWAEAGDA